MAGSDDRHTFSVFRNCPNVFVFSVVELLFGLISGGSDGGFLQFCGSFNVGVRGFKGHLDLP